MAGTYIMTEETRRQLKNQILADASEAEEDFNYIQVETERVADALSEISAVLKTDPAQLLDENWRARIDPLLTRTVRAPFHTSIFFESLLALVRSYDTAKKKVEALERHKKTIRIS